MTRHMLLTTGLAAVLVLPSISAFAASAPEDFIRTALQGDNSEIMLGHLAEQKGGSQQVRDFGTMLVTDHTTAKNEASEVAKSLKVSVSDNPSSDAKDEQDKLSKLSGRDFDKEFGTFMVTDHTKDIRDFQDEANANNGPASSLAAKQVPVLQKHLRMAEMIAGPSGSSAAAVGNAPTQENAGQWRASKLAGVAIYGPDNKTVGKISDVLLNKDGKAEYVVIGVGGFLGIGQKDVALPYDKVRFSDEPVTGSARSAPANPNTTSASTGASTPTTEQTSAPAAGTATGLGAPNSGSRSIAYPDHGTIDLTADQLKAAPTFHLES